jgi:hypothetical protein
LSAGLNYGTGATTSGTVSVVFANPCSSTPIVTATVVGIAPFYITVDNLSTTGFDVYIFDTTGTAADASFTWFAIQ